MMPLGIQDSGGLKFNLVLTHPFSSLWIHVFPFACALIPVDMRQGLAKDRRDSCT